MTDPPYGSLVQYLDLSSIWLNWPKNIDSKYTPNYNAEITIKNGVIDINLYQQRFTNALKNLRIVLKNENENQERYVIFPYEKINGKNQIIKEEKLKKRFPLTYKYFLEIKKELDKRDKGKSNPICFYTFGRNHGLDNTFGSKILTSSMNLRPNFIINENEETTFYAGYCIKYKGDLKELQNALNSKDMEFYINNISRDYQNNWKSYAKSFIENFGISKLSFNIKKTIFDY